MIYTVADDFRIVTLDWTPNMFDIEYWGYMFFDGIRREVREIHRTQNGIQIELYPRHITPYGFF